MGHMIQAVIGKIEYLSPFSGWDHAHLVPLPQGYAMVPITATLLESIGGLAGNNEPAPYPEFDLLTVPLLDMIKQCAKAGGIAYIETEYFGGIGEQAAGVWSDGKLIMRPLRTAIKWTSAMASQPQEEAINLALRALGVCSSSSEDAFDALELGRYRSMEQWEPEDTD